MRINRGLIEFCCQVCLQLRAQKVFDLLGSGMQVVAG